MQGSSIHVANSVLDSTRMDNSFVVLPKQRPQSHGVPPCPRASAIQLDASQSGKAMDESFVVVYKSESPSDGGGPQLPSLEGGTNGPMQTNNSGFHSTITVLKRAFEIATSQMQVEQPLCLECMRVLFDKLDKEVEDVTRDIESYEACLQHLEGEAWDVLSEADFLEEKLKIEEEERKLEAAIEETEKQNAEVNAELKELELKSKQFKELEERPLLSDFAHTLHGWTTEIYRCFTYIFQLNVNKYWQEFNNFQFQLIAHQEERDAISAKIEVSQAHLELLKPTNVLNDAFPIWHDGEFGTINNFRIGRLPKIHVEWDEINAAWGQACLLLHTMRRYFEPKFQYRIKLLPIGSYPRIMDGNNNAYELFGPVNLFWSTHYNKAMTLFLTCLKEFAGFVNSKYRENNIPLDKCFKFPYKIESDKVENYAITLNLNKQENWTKALKYTFRNLKWVVYWFVGNTNFRPLSAMASSPAEVPFVGSLYAKHGTDLKSVARSSSRPSY